MKLLFVPGKPFNQRKKHFYQILTTLGPKLTVTLRKSLPPKIRAGLVEPRVLIDRKLDVIG